MIKRFSQGDITVRPFTTHKNWTIQSTSPSEVDAFGESTYYTFRSERNDGLYVDPQKSFSESDEKNPSGKYKRLVYQSIYSMFYEYPTDPTKTFGLEKWGGNHIEGKEEKRELHDHFHSFQIKRSIWGEKIQPTSIKISDWSNLHQPYKIEDDGYTNLFISGAFFTETNTIYPFKDHPSEYKWMSSLGTFTYTSPNGDVEVLNSVRAKEYMDMGLDVVPILPTFGYDSSTETFEFDSKNEHFGECVTLWSCYLAVGSPMDTLNLSVDKQGYVGLYKFDESKGLHRPIKRFFSPFSDRGIYQDYTNETAWINLLKSQGILQSEPATTLNGFGSSVALGGDSLAIGSPLHNVGTDTGYVFIYHKYKGGSDHWGMINVLQGDNDGDKFGHSIAIDGNTMVVGAPGYNGGRGAVYVFKKFQYGGSGDDGIPAALYWQHVLSETGADLVMENGVLIASERQSPSYVSGNYTWIYQTRITTSHSIPNDNFGWSVDVSNGKILVGTNTDRDGYAVLFTGSGMTWTQEQIFEGNNDRGDLPDDPMYVNEVGTSFNGFGSSVALDGDLMGICAPYDKAFRPYETADDSETKILGAAYLYNFVYDHDCCRVIVNPILKTFGDRSVIANNNFAKTISINGTRMAISSEPDQLIRSVQYTSQYLIESKSYDTLGETDAVLGRVQTYRFTSGSWNSDLILKDNKEKDLPFYVHGKSAYITEDFLAIGSPIYNQAQGNVSDVLSNTASFPYDYRGRTIVYDYEKYQVDPYIGNIFYRNGLIVITHTGSSFTNILTNSGSRGFEMEFQGSHTILENECLVTINPGEFNYSTNPTALIKDNVLFDVNQDGIFDVTDLQLIMTFLAKNRFKESRGVDDNGYVLEQQTDNWWADDIILTESEDVLELEVLKDMVNKNPYGIPDKVYNYINEKLISTKILDIDGNGVIDPKDGYLLMLYYYDKLTPNGIKPYIDKMSTRTTTSEIERYIDPYAGCRQFTIEPNFHSYVESSSIDPTGSYLSPYITSIGLYQENELVAVAKLGRPIKNLIDWPVNIVVRFDT